MGTIVLDASVIIAFLYEPDPLHAVATTLLPPSLTADQRVLVPTTVYSEILVGAIRTGAEDIVDRFLEDTGSELVPVDRAIARRAAELRATHRSLRLPDALVLATAHERAAMLLTLDRRLQSVAEVGV